VTDYPARGRRVEHGGGRGHRGPRGPRRRSSPTLRFYQWQPACVSLGRHQPLADIDLARCAALGYDVVRRPTGGRAILHTDELTYSVAGPQDDPILAGAVLDSYLRLSQGLLAGLERLGLSSARRRRRNRSGADAGPVCFEVPSAYEIVVPPRRSSSEAYRDPSSEAYRDPEAYGAPRSWSAAPRAGGRGGFCSTARCPWWGT
jgi:lipoate-protein ligase A